VLWNGCGYFVTVCPYVVIELCCSLSQIVAYYFHKHGKAQWIAFPRAGQGRCGLRVKPKPPAGFFIWGMLGSCVQWTNEPGNKTIVASSFITTMIGLAKGVQNLICGRRERQCHGGYPREVIVPPVGNEGRRRWNH
jgi:hypothetical protein